MGDKFVPVMDASTSIVKLTGQSVSENLGPSSDRSCEIVLHVSTGSFEQDFCCREVRPVIFHFSIIRLLFHDYQSVLNYVRMTLDPKLVMEVLRTVYRKDFL